MLPSHLSPEAESILKILHCGSTDGISHAMADAEYRRLLAPIRTQFPVTCSGSHVSDKRDKDNKMKRYHRRVPALSSMILRQRYICPLPRDCPIGRDVLFTDSLILVAVLRVCTLNIRFTNNRYEWYSCRLRVRLRAERLQNPQHAFPGLVYTSPLIGLITFVIMKPITNILLKNEITVISQFHNNGCY